MIGVARVAAVTVTYGERHELAIKTVASAIAAGVHRVFVVINGCPPRTRDAIAVAMEQYDPGLVTLIDLDINYGSAGGFHAGLVRAGAEPDVDYIWLLDDDNWPAENSLQTALASMTELERSTSRNVVLSCYRGHQLAHLDLLRGRPMADTYPNPGSAVHFDLRRRLRRRPQTATLSRRAGCVKIPFAPYGGMLMRRTVVSVESILPRPDLVLYADDYEYSVRIRRAGIAIYLCFDAVVVDSDDASPIFTPGDPRGIVRLLRTPPARHTLLYYHLRNDVYLDRLRANALFDKLMLRLNLLCWFAALLLYAARSRTNRSGLIIALVAATDGWLGRLGMRRPLA